MPSEHSFVHHRTLESAFYDALPPGTYNNTFINNDVRGESRVFARGVSFPSLSFSLYVCLLLSLPSNPSFLSFLPFFLSFFVSKRNNSTSPGWRVEAPLLSRRSVRVPKDNAKLQGTRAIYGGVGLEKRTKPVCPFRATFEKKVESLTIDSIISQKLLSTKCYSFFDIYIYILTRYYSYITSHRTSKYFFSQSSFETLSHPHSFQNVLTRFKNGTLWSLWQERYLNTFRNALRKYSKFVYGEKEAGREGVSCMDSRGICIYVCPSYREIRGRRGSLNEAWGMDPRQRQRPPRLYSN